MYKLRKKCDGSKRGSGRKAGTKVYEEGRASKSRGQAGLLYRQTFPQTTLQQAQKIASALVDNFASDSGSPPDVALALGISPTSSGWPMLAGASIAYGLTDGGVNANVMKLTSLGRRLRSPEAEGQDVVARREAILMPRILPASSSRNIVAQNFRMRLSLRTYSSRLDSPQTEPKLRLKLSRRMGATPESFARLLYRSIHQS